MRPLRTGVLLAVVLAVVVTPAFGTKPGETVNPNGFPSGDHYNLNIIGKNENFACPAQEYDDAGNPVYGDVIFVPQNGIGIQILMESGTGKRALAVPTLQVTDPCTALFDADAAVVQLPAWSEGYDVYARALATPTDNPSMSITPDLVAVEDEFGNDLIYLGLVTSDGFRTPYVSMQRTKGRSTAVDITGLFEWSGDVCYFSSIYCDPVTGCQSTRELCCTDADANGVFESCAPFDPLLGCPTGTTQITAYCNTYTDEWVFNIGDFVTYLWNLDNNGLKLLQVRFYPR